MEEVLPWIKENPVVSSVLATVGTSFLVMLTIGAVSKTRSWIQNSEDDGTGTPSSNLKVEFAKQGRGKIGGGGLFTVTLRTMTKRERKLGTLSFGSTRCRFLSITGLISERNYPLTSFFDLLDGSRSSLNIGLRSRRRLTLSLRLSGGATPTDGTRAAEKLSHRSSDIQQDSIPGSQNM